MNILRIVALGFLLLCNPLLAQDDSDTISALIEKVSEAYGGEALRSLRNWDIRERYLSPSVGQSWHPDLTDIGTRNFRVVQDFESSSIYQETWFISPNGLFPNLNIVKGDEGWTVDLRDGSYGALNNRDPYALIGGTMRTTDTLLARELINGADDAEYLGDAMWQNRAHERVRIPMPSSPDLTLYVDSASGYITRMSRENPAFGVLDYVFNDHGLVDGIVTAKSVSFSIAGDLNLVGFDRQVRFNQELAADTFSLPSGLSVEAARIDDSEMVVNRLSDAVHHIGQNAAYSLFVDAGSEVIGIGAYAGLSQRLAKFREVTNNHRPLKHLVVSHHHQDHIGGIDDALDHSATLVTVRQNADVLKEASNHDLTDASMLFVNERLTLGSGAGEVQLYDVSTTHSSSNLLFYVPSTKTLFLADHFGGAFAEGTPRASANTISMAAALEPLDLGFNRVVTAHGARVYSARDFRESVEAYTDFTCPADRPLCSD